MTVAFTLLLALLCACAALLLMAALWSARTRLAELRRLDALLGRSGRENVEDGLHGFLDTFLAAHLLRAGWEPGRRQIVLALGIFAGAVLLACAFAGALAGLSLGVASMLLGMGVLQYRVGVNMRRLSDAMLGLLERLRQLLSVGNSLPVALARAVENSPPAMRKALACTVRRIANGAGTADSIARVAAELDVYELHLLATAARTNLRFGGSLTQVLKNIIETVRRRAAVERELRAGTTQIRASAWVLALLPLLVSSIVMFTNQDYARWFLATGSGHWMIGYAAVSQAVGIFAMRLITRTRY